MEHPKPSNALRALLLFVGAGVAPALAALGLFGLEDLELVAEARLRSDATLRVRAAQAEWEARLSRPEPIASAVASLDLHAPGSGDAAGPAAVEPPLPADSAAQLHALAARADVASGDLAAASAHVKEAVAASPPSTGHVLMAIAQGLRIRGDKGGDLGAALDLFDAHARTVSFSVPYQGTSARLLALLCAEPVLPPDLRAQQLLELRKAIRSSAIALPHPQGDRMKWTALGPVLQSDPWWAALETASKARLPEAAAAFDVLFAREQRLASAVLKSDDGWKDRALPDRWSVRPMPDHGLWTAWRGSPAQGWRLTVHTGAQLDDALNGRDSTGATADGAADFQVSGFAQAQTDPLTEPLPLKDVPTALTIAHPKPALHMAPLTRRFRTLRLGLLITAVLIAAAAAFAWGALTRSARLRSLRSTFVASVSHDLRTPVATIGLLAENMAHGYHRGSETQYVESLQGESSRLRRLIDDLLDFGRIERGLPPQVRREPVLLEPWITGFVDSERPRCHERGCAVDLTTESLPGSAHLDKHALERALSNLMDNAIKHGRAASIEIRARGASDELTFEVIDAGSGLAPSALRADLFRPFERGGVGSEGTGLGLSIVKEIAHAHGGRASLAAHEDGGAVATLTVALAEEDVA